MCAATRWVVDHTVRWRLGFRRAPRDTGLCAGSSRWISRLKCNWRPLTAAADHGLAQLQRLLPITLPTSVFRPARYALPYINIAPLTPETLRWRRSSAKPPHGDRTERPSTLLAPRPHDVNFELLTRLLAARDRSGSPSASLMCAASHATYAAALGLVIDDNTEPHRHPARQPPAAHRRTGRRKNFPLPLRHPLDPLALLGDKLVSPAAPNTLYRGTTTKRPYPRRTPAPHGDASPTPAAKSPTYTNSPPPTAAGRRRHRSVLPTRLLTDVLTANLGNRQGDLHNLRYDNGITSAPLSTSTRRHRLRPRHRPHTKAPAPSSLPGYNHLGRSAPPPGTNTTISQNRSVTPSRFRRTTTSTSVATPRRASSRQESRSWRSTTGRRHDQLSESGYTLAAAVPA